MVKATFNLTVIKHSAFVKQKIKTVAVCGGAGAFLISKAANKGADVFISSDFKYDNYFTTTTMPICDIGHYESEQFTMDLISDHLKKFFPTFAVFQTQQCTNPIYYFI